MATDTYLTIKSPSEGIFKDIGSKFIAYAYPVSAENQAREYLEALRKEHHSARHHCWAYRLGHDGTNWKANDDGEPSNSAGKPILGQILSKNLTNVVVIVVRYFGGTLLGVGGLMQAYKESTADALNNAEIVEAIVESTQTIRFPYLVMNEVMKVMKYDGVRIVEQLFDNNCSITFSVRLSSAEIVTSKILKIEGLQIE